jgi:gamma-glutamyltranspeptidase/glutathione hydrolase
MRRRLLLLLAGLLAGAAPLAAREPATAWRQMVAAAHPLAAEAGLRVLRQGGSAIDAAVAVQAVLGLVEPQSSGIGGGAFILTWNAADRRVSAWDGRETAPAAVTPGLFLMPDRTPMGFLEAAVGGRAVGVPGAVAALEAAHAAEGRLPWDSLFRDAIELATLGFPVSARLAAAVAANRERLARDAAARAYFLAPDGTPWPAGHILRNPAYAETLRSVAARRAAALADGPVAEAIVAAVQGAAGNPGSLSRGDLAAYRAVAREPVCMAYRVWRVCGMGPPSSGGLGVGQILGLLAQFDLGGLDPLGAEAAHLLAEASRLAFADRNLYVADPGFVRVPARGMLDPAYLAARAGLIDRNRAGMAPRPGEPPWREGALHAPDPAVAEHGTSHLAIVDAAGNAVSMTTTVEDALGARIMAAGFVLNNQLTDFSFRPEIDGRPVANRVEPGKRPRSSMSPTLVFDAEGALVAVVGSAGGARIIGYVAQALVAMLDWRLDPQAAVDLPHVGTVGGETELEAGTAAAALAPELEARGHRLGIREMTSGTQAILRRPDGWSGGADRRRAGVALGD